MLLIAFIIHQDLLKDIWNGFSYEALLHWKVYLKLAIPGMAMICLQVMHKSITTFIVKVPLHY